MLKKLQINDSLFDQIDDTLKKIIHRIYLITDEQKIGNKIRSDQHKKRHRVAKSIITHFMGSKLDNYYKQAEYKEQPLLIRVAYLNKYRVSIKLSDLPKDEQY